MNNLLRVLVLLLSLFPVMGFAFNASEPAPFTVKLDGVAEETFYDAVADEAGNLYMVGAYTSLAEAKVTVYGDGSADDMQRTLLQTWNLPPSNGASDLVVVKLTPLGQIDWVIALGGAGNDAATGVVFDRVNQRVFVSGYITDTLSAHPFYEATTAEGIDVATTTNLFVAALNTSFGNIEYFETLPLVKEGTDATVSNLVLSTGDARSESVMQLQGQSLALAYDQELTSDSAASLYIKGQITPVAQAGAKLGIEPGNTYGIDAQSGHWAFVAKVEYRETPQNGDERWDWQWMTPLSSQRGEQDSTVITQMSVDLDQGTASPLYVTGYWSGSVTAGVQAPRVSQGQQSGFVAAFQASTGQTNFLASVGGDSTLNTLVTDNNGNLIVAGNVARVDEASSEVQLQSANSVSGTTLSITPDWTTYPKSSERYKHRAFVAKLDKLGDWDWATPLTGRYSSALDLQRSSDGGFYLTGGLGKHTAFNGYPSANSALDALTLGELNVNNEIVSITLEQQLADYAVASPLAPTSEDLFIPQWHEDTLSCPAGTQLLNGNCYESCTVNYNAVGDQCVQEQNSYSSPPNSSCSAGYDLIGSFCYDTCDPDEPWIWDATQCWDGAETFERYFECPGDVVNGVCYPLCEAGYERDGDACVAQADQYPRPFSVAVAACVSTNNCSISLAQSDISIEFLRNGSVFASATDTKLRGKADINSPPYMNLMNYLDEALDPNPKAINPLVAPNPDSSHLIWNDAWQVRFVHNDLTSTDYQLSHDLVFSFVLADERVNEITLPISLLKVDSSTGSITSDLGVGLDFVGFVEPELVPDSFAFVARFHDTGIAAEFDWVQWSSNEDTHGSLLVLSPHQTLYSFGGRGHYPRLTQQMDEAVNYTERDASEADTLSSRGTIMNAINPDTGVFLPEFLRYFEFIIGNKIEPPVGGYNHTNVITLRKTYPENMLVDNPTVDGSPRNKQLLSAPSNHGVYAAGPLSHGLVLWPTNPTLSLPNQPLIGKAIKIRWPTVEEGLQEYIYSTDSTISLPNHVMNSANAQNTFHWIHFAETTEDEIVNEQTVPAGTPITTGIGFSEVPLDPNAQEIQLGLQLNTSANRRATLVYFDGIDFNQGPPTIRAVQSYHWQQKLTQNQAADIGTTLESPVLESPAQYGYVMTDVPRYDAEIYLREQRHGQIIPVNENGNEDSQALYVAWYQASDDGREWPYAAVHYEPTWPATDSIVIASQMGTNTPPVNGEEVSLLGLHEDNNPTLYYQNDREKAGYNPNEEHAVPYQPSGSSYVQFYALREDLNHLNAQTSDPYVLVRYEYLEDPEDVDSTLLYGYRVWKVEAFTVQYPTFNLNPAIAGNPVLAPFPLNVKPGLASLDTNGSGEGFWLDKDGKVWSRSNASFIVNYHYKLQEGFWNDLDGDGVLDESITDVAWPRDSIGSAISLDYTSAWPSDLEIQLVNMGESLLNFTNKNSLQIVFDENDPENLDLPSANRAANATVRLLDLSAVVTEALPESVSAAQFDGLNLNLIYDAGSGAQTLSLPARLDNSSGHYSFPSLPTDLRYRLRFNPYIDENPPPSELDPDVAGDPRGQFYFQGGQFDSSTAQPVVVTSSMLMISVLTEKESSVLKLLDNADAFANDVDDNITVWDQIVDGLYQKSRNPQGIDLVSPVGPDQQLLVGFEQSGNGLLHQPINGEPLLSTAFAQQGGYVVLAENVEYNPDDTSPVALTVIRVLDNRDDGSLNVIRNADNALDQRLIVRQDLDFGGRADDLVFDWWWHPDVEGEPDVEIGTDGLPEGNLWQRLELGQGINALTLSHGLPVIADGWMISRYREASDENGWSEFSGQDGVNPGDIRPVNTSGWVRRVLEGINLFESRYTNFHDTEAESYTSMLKQAGTPYIYDVALTTEDNNLNEVGLIELYQTVLNQAIKLSIEANNPITEEIAVNKQLLLATSRISDMYMLLGNEAFSDAMDPTIGIQSSNGDTGYLAPTLFAFSFSDQLASLLEEELALLRGVDRRDPFPVFNRLPWNFTSGIEGEPTYVQVYGISDTNGNGSLDEAAQLYPQGHGDAWGHYLTATKMYYSLARHPNYDWQPVTDTTQIGDISLQVDYKDEQRFARAAAAKARTGARIVDLTFREQYTHSPSGQWQGYKDTDPDRAWGMDGWARRSGQAAVLDWALGNALLPYEDESAQNELEKIDRQTVVELDALPAALSEIDALVTLADQGNNPLGFSPEAIAFDVDPEALAAGETHFDQIYQRALSAATSSLALFDYANDLSQQLRVNQLDTAEFQKHIEAQEQDFRSRLIELLGYPYAGEIGSGKLYPTGYNGPDLYHYLFIDNNLGAVPLSKMESFNLDYSLRAGATHLFPNDMKDSSGNILDLNDSGVFNVDQLVSTIPFPYVENNGHGFFAPVEWGARQAPGKIQQQLGEMQLIQARINTANAEHSALLGKIEDQIELIEDLYGIYADQISVFDDFIQKFKTANAFAITARQMGEILEKSGDSMYKLIRSVKEAPPKVVGWAAFDPSFTMRFAAEITAATTKASTSLVAAGVARAVQIPAQILAEQATFEARITIIKANYSSDVAKEMTELEMLMRDELTLRYQMVELIQEMDNANGGLSQLLGEAARLMEEREIFRRDVASRTLDKRYQDITYRIFRNDALQKYRAGFDQAARYTYLAAKAFDYETGLLSDDPNDQHFFEQLVRQRTLGFFANGETPVAGTEGLSTPLANMANVFQDVKSDYGFYAAQPEQYVFSLRNEAFRVGSTNNTQLKWQELLQNARVTDLRALADCRRYCRIPDDEMDEPQKGIVLRFSTTVESAKNLFGWPLGPGDKAYDSSFTATKIHSVGIHFDNYPDQLLAGTPRAYLIPVGTDIMRSPTSTNPDRDPALPVLRYYNVLEQSIPLPSDLTDLSFQNDADWIPLHGAVDESWAKVRRFTRMPVSYGSVFDPGNDTYTNTRLSGRSVWNTEWMLVIPGATLLADADEGLSRLINGDPNVPELNGITDIKLYFDTYSIPGL